MPDLMDVLTDQLVIAGVDSVPMLARTRELGLEVDRFVPVHGVPITGEQFRKAFAIRAKYVHWVSAGTAGQVTCNHGDGLH